MKGVLPGACARQRRNGDSEPAEHSMDPTDSLGNSEQTPKFLNAQTVPLCFFRKSIGVR